MWEDGCGKKEVLGETVAGDVGDCLGVDAARELPCDLESSRATLSGGSKPGELRPSRHVTRAGHLSALH
jgi:hypothetical protein